LNPYRQAREDHDEPHAYNFVVAKGIAVFVPRRKPMTDGGVISNSLTAS
jgi:hypothetical protein